MTRRSRKSIWGKRSVTELLKVDKLWAGYGDAVVLEDISFTLEEGGSLALLGRNGMGKTTLLSTLMGIGGGLFSNLLMTFYGRPIHQAIGTSAGLAVLISIPGALGYIYAGWPAASR